MYYVKIKTSGKLSELAVGRQGRVRRTGKGDTCAVSSLAAAQEMARLFARYDLLA